MCAFLGFTLSAVGTSASPHHPGEVSMNRFRDGGLEDLLEREVMKVDDGA